MTSKSVSIPLERLEEAARIVEIWAYRNPRWRNNEGVEQDPYGVHEWLEWYRRTPHETTCSAPSPSDTQESAFAFVLSVAADERFSNEYLGNVVRSWLHVLDGSSTPVKTSADDPRIAGAPMDKREHQPPEPLMATCYECDYCKVWTPITRTTCSGCGRHLNGEV